MVGIASNFILPPRTPVDLGVNPAAAPIPAPIAPKPLPADQQMAVTQPNIVAPQVQSSLWDKINGALKQPGMAAALLRSAGATFDGGIGAGIAAGGDYMDQFHHRQDAAKQQGFENDLATKKTGILQQDADQTGQYQNGQVQNGMLQRLVDMNRAESDAQHQKASEALTARGQDYDHTDRRYSTDVGAATTTRGQDVSAATTTRGQDLSHDASIYGSNLGYLKPAGGAGIGSKTTTTVKIPAKPAENHWFSPDVPEVPATTVSTTTPMAPAAPSLPSAVATTPPPASAVAALKANPGLKGQFEQKYGAGSATRVLGGL